MATSSQGRVKEGDKLIVEAEKCLKTGWLKWAPDYAGAAHAFDKAALCYRNAKASDRAIDAYERAAQTYSKSGVQFQAGRSLEQAAHVAQERKATEQAAMLLERASTHYHESGHGDTAGQVLTKAAKLVEGANPRRAADYHLACVELHLIEDKQREAANATRRAACMCARARDLDKLREVLDSLKRLYEELQLHKQLWNVAAMEVLLHLHLDDNIAANDTLQDAMRVPGFLNSDEAPVLQQLCDSFVERDGDAVAEACGNVVFRSMETDIAKLALDLRRKFDPTSPSTLSPQSSLPPSSTVTSPPSSASKPSSSSSSSSTAAPPILTSPPKPAKLSDMRAELFGGGQQSSKPPQKQRVEEREGEREGEGGKELEEEGREEVRVKDGRETEEGAQEGAQEAGEEEEEGGGDGDDDNAYGGMLT